MKASRWYGAGPKPYGDTKTIEDAGGHIFYQTCIAMSPIRHYPEGIVIDMSIFKYVKLGAGFGPKWIYANQEALINAAVTGVFTPTARWDYWSQPKEKRLASEKEHPLYQGEKPMVD